MWFPVANHDLSSCRLVAAGTGGGLSRATLVEVGEGSQAYVTEARRQSCRLAGVLLPLLGQTCHLAPSGLAFGSNIHPGSQGQWIMRS